MNKMILVPHDILGRDAGNAVMNNLDREMNKILQDKYLPADSKMIQYLQVLRKYNTALDEKTKPYELEIRSEEQPVAISNDTETDTLLAAVPSKWRKNAEMLLWHVRKNPHMQWSDKGELIVEGNKIVGSNIVDLLADFSKDSRNRRPAIGAEIFAKNLLKENIPRESVVNKKRLEVVQDTAPVLVAPSSSTPSNETPKRRSVWSSIF